MAPLAGAGVGGAECYVKFGAEEKPKVQMPQRRLHQMMLKQALKRGSGEAKQISCGKMRQNLRTAFELHTRSVPFRFDADKAQARRLGGTGRQTGPVHTGGQWVGCTCAMWHAACSDSGGGGGMRCRLWLHFGLQIV